MFPCFTATTFSLNFDGANLFSKIVQVKEGVLITSINPTKTAAGLPTTFKININQTNNITSYEWDFGDNSTSQTDLTTTAIHTYD